MHGLWKYFGMDWWEGLLLVCFVTTVIVLALGSSALPHDWYTKTVNEKGQGCCGVDDCAPLADGDVTETKGGYFVKSRRLFVPFSRTQPSVDEHYHMCIVSYDIPDNHPRCFFAPMPGS